jgi:peptide/nickel transport system substrate-binding protein
MQRFKRRLATSAVIGCALGLGGPVAAEEPQHGGNLTFVTPSDIPSYDGHRETTFGVIHPIGPFYSVLIRVDPAVPYEEAEIVCDLCLGEVPEPTNGGTTYTFDIKQGVTFHDGTPLTAHDVKASLEKVMFPPEGIPSARQAFFGMVDSIEVPDDHTLVINLHYPSGAFIPALANPYNWIYSKKDLDEHGLDWHTSNVNGSGPFVFVQHQPGAFVEGRRNENYHVEGLPYMDGFRSIEAPRMAVNVQALRGGRAGAQFRGFPPAIRDQLRESMGDRIVAQESDWNCSLIYVSNQAREPFNDPRVRQALTLALDRWGGSEHLSRIAIVRTVGGVSFPGHPLSATREELEQMRGYWPDLEESRAEARRLLEEAGRSNLQFEFLNRNIDQPYLSVGVWLLDQWSEVGMDVSQRVTPSGPFFESLRGGGYDVSVDWTCEAGVNPLLDVSKFLGSSGSNYGNYEDPVLEDLFERMNRTADVVEQRKLMRQFDERALSEMAHMGITLWWYRIALHRDYFKGWHVSPSHYLNQQLDNVWLDRSLM